MRHARRLATLAAMVPRLETRTPAKVAKVAKVGASFSKISDFSSPGRFDFLSRRVVKFGRDKVRQRAHQSSPLLLTSR